ncbi:hypothetical protein JG687_00016312 [Phytophthora cactorum]|uniref:Uncharacterized protein n=1 Tax=Phytophthora cactorum TaxID=29920 RepID=A0A8T1TUT0_9STRA|nr:hypothetical protein JG687_00016312 [Phytophthora cactorum]
MRDASAAATGTLVPWETQKATNRLGWMRFTNLPSISAGTLYGNMERVVKATENIIGEEMPRNSVSFQTVGRTAASIILLFLVAPDGPQYPLLSMALIMDEPDDALNTDGHAAPIGRLLPFFGRSLTDVHSWWAAIVQPTKRWLVSWTCRSSAEQATV